MILLPSGAVSVGKGRVLLGGLVPSSRRQGRACWQIVEHLSRDSIICTTSFIWLSSRSDQTWKLRGMRLEGSCQITFSPAIPCLDFKMQLFFLHDLQLQNNFLSLFLKNYKKIQWNGVRAEPVPQLYFQPELCSWKSPSAFQPSPCEQAVRRCRGSWLHAGPSGQGKEGGWEKAVQNFAVTFLGEICNLPPSVWARAKNVPRPHPALARADRGACAGLIRPCWEAVGESLQRVLSPCPHGVGTWRATSDPILVLSQLQHPLG